MHTFCSIAPFPPNKIICSIVILSNCFILSTYQHTMLWRYFLYFFFLFIYLHQQISAHVLDLQGFSFFFVNKTFFVFYFCILHWFVILHLLQRQLSRVFTQKRSTFNGKKKVILKKQETNARISREKLSSHTIYAEHQNGSKLIGSLVYF